MSDSSRPHGLQPTRLLHPWDFPGRSTGVGCHCLLLVYAIKNITLFALGNSFIYDNNTQKIVFGIHSTDKLEKEMAPHSSTPAWKIPWMEEPGRLQSIGSLRVGQHWANSLSFSLSCIGEGNGNPLQCTCLENSRDRGAWCTAVYGVAQSRTRLKWLSSSNSSSSLNP